MRKTALAKTVNLAQSEAPELARLRTQVVCILGDVYGAEAGIWAQAARRAADRILTEVIGGVTRRPIPVSSVNVSLAGAGTRRSDSHRR
jgi:hypothetical protein